VSTPWGSNVSAADVFNHTFGTNLDADQVQAAILLHELWHNVKGDGVTDNFIDSIEANRDMLKACFTGKK